MLFEVLADDRREVPGLAGYLRGQLIGRHPPRRKSLLFGSRWSGMRGTVDWS